MTGVQTCALPISHRTQVDGVYPKLFEDFPTANRMCEAPSYRLEHDLMHLGLHHRRAMTLHRFSHWWMTAIETTGIPGEQLETVLGQVNFPPSFLERVHAMEPPGIGEYARDSWAIFVEGRLPDWEVRDHALAAWLTDQLDPSMWGDFNRRPWETPEHWAARTARPPG